MEKRDVGHTSSLPNAVLDTGATCPIGENYNMKRFALLFAVVALLIGTGVASAQNGAFAPYVTAGVGVQGGQLDLAAKTNPNFAFGGGIESSTKHFLLDANATYNTADNVVTSNGYTVKADASGYYKLGKFLAGAGVNESINNITPTAAEISKLKLASTYQGFHPYVGGGIQTAKFRALATYLLPAKDAQTNERITNLNAEIFATKHIRVTGGVQIDSAIPTGSTTRQLAVGASTGIKFVL